MERGGSISGVVSFVVRFFGLDFLSRLSGVDSLILRLDFGAVAKYQNRIKSNSICHVK